VVSSTDTFVKTEIDTFNSKVALFADVLLIIIEGDYYYYLNMVTTDVYFFSKAMHYS